MWRSCCGSCVGLKRLIGLSVADAVLGVGLPGERLHISSRDFRPLLGKGRSTGASPRPPPPTGRLPCGDLPCGDLALWRIAVNGEGYRDR